MEDSTEQSNPASHGIGQHFLDTTETSEEP